MGDPYGGIDPKALIVFSTIGGLAGLLLSISLARIAYVRWRARREERVAVTAAFVDAR